MNSQIKEAVNRAEVTKIFLENEWMVYTPEADVDGVDFVVMSLKTSEVRKVQLKGRWTVDEKYKKYKNIWICFPDGNNWYLCEHDQMIKFGKKCKWSLWIKEDGSKRDAYSRKPLPVAMKKLLSDYLILKQLKKNAAA